MEHCSDDVAHYTELEEETQLHSCQFRLLNTPVAQVKDQTESLEAVAHELWQKVIEMLVDELQVLREVN